MSDSFLTDAGSLFFAVLILMIAAVSIVAFGRDLLPQRARIRSAATSVEKPRKNP